MGEVYSTHSEGLEGTWAIKRVIESFAQDPEIHAMFLREVAVASTLDHPNVVEVIDAGQANGELFMVMELVEGPSLAEIIAQNKRAKEKMPPKVACAIISGAALGLQHAHEREAPDGTSLQIVHRDVAAENILLTKKGVPKVVDFGLAKVAGSNMTQPGIIRGRPRTIPPEQARGEAVDPRTDLFSLGAILFELLAGEPLYTEASLATLLFKVAQGDYSDVPERLAHIEPDLVDIVVKSVATDPSERFQSARAFSRTLDGYRASRGMPMKADVVAGYLASRIPQIETTRQRDLKDGAGDLENTHLVLPADAQDTDDLLLKQPPRQESALESLARAQLGEEPSSIFPRPLAPQPSEDRTAWRGEGSWLIYAGVLFVVGVFVFFHVYRSS